MRDAGAAGAGPAAWRPPLVPLAVGVPPAERPAALAADGGIGDLLAAIDAHAAHLAGRDATRRGERARAEVASRAQAALQAALRRCPTARGGRRAASAAPPAARPPTCLRAAADGGRRPRRRRGRRRGGADGVGAAARPGSDAPDTLDP
jgi:hypothetical protein